MAHRAVGLELLSDVPAGVAASQGRGIIQRPKDSIPTTSGSFFVAGSTANAHTITLQIDGLKDESCQKRVEEELVRVRGVISFTFSLPEQRCVIRCKGSVHPSRLCNAVANTEDMEALQVVRKESGEERLVSFVTVADSLGPSPGLPDYLPEEDPEIPDNAVLRHGDEASSEGWLSSAARFLARSLYW